MDKTEPDKSDSNTSILTASDLPPIGISSILHFAWGMTLNLSHQDQQRYLAEVFKDRFVALWTQYANDQKAIAFLNEVAFILSASERSYGFERDVYFSRIDEWSELKQDKTEYYKSLANITSSNVDSIYSRSLAFVGAGSAAGFADLLKPLTSLNTEFTAVFLATGAVGFGIFTFILKYVSKNKIIKTDIEYNEYIDQYWQDTLRPYLAKIYEHLAEDLNKVYMNHYKIEANSFNREAIKKEIDEMLPNKMAYSYKYPKTK